MEERDTSAPDRAAGAGPISIGHPNLYRGVFPAVRPDALDPTGPQRSCL